MNRPRLRSSSEPRPAQESSPEGASIAARRIALSSNRALVLDVLHFARQVPTFPVERTFELAEIAALRAKCRARISWAVLFMKAFALVAREHPPLRRAWQPWPWPHFIEHSHSVASLAIHREFQGESRLCWGKFEHPETRPLTYLAGQLRQYQQHPVEEVFRMQVQLSRLPGVVRRAILGWNLHLSGSRRAKRVGTFSVSTLAGQGVLNRGHPSFLTTSLTYGPLDSEGRSTVTLLCDHRVLDGHLAAVALAELQQVLCGEIAAELASLGKANRGRHSEAA